MYTPDTDRQEKFPMMKICECPVNTLIDLEPWRTVQNAPKTSVVAHLLKRQQHQVYPLKATKGLAYEQFLHYEIFFAVSFVLHNHSIM